MKTFTLESQSTHHYRLQGKGKAFVLYVPKKSISFSHILLISIDFPSNMLAIFADSSGIDKDSINPLIYISHILQK